MVDRFFFYQNIPYLFISYLFTFRSSLAWYLSGMILLSKYVPANECWKSNFILHSFSNMIIPFEKCALSICFVFGPITFLPFQNRLSPFYLPYKPCPCLRFTHGICSLHLLTTQTTGLRMMLGAFTSTWGRGHGHGMAWHGSYHYCHNVYRVYY